jgi:hypothetical protein
MEYFPLGSLASYIPQTLDEVISIINQVIACSITINHVVIYSSRVYI